MLGSRRGSAPRARGPASDAPPGLSEAIRPAALANKNGFARFRRGLRSPFGGSDTLTRPASRCASHRVSPGRFVRRQFVGRGCVWLRRGPATMPNLLCRIDRCQHEQFFEFEQTLGGSALPATDEPRQPMRMLIHFTHFPLQPTVKQPLKFLRGRVNLRLAPRASVAGESLVAGASRPPPCPRFPVSHTNGAGSCDIKGCVFALRYWNFDKWTRAPPWTRTRTWSPSLPQLRDGGSRSTTRRSSSLR